MAVPPGAEREIRVTGHTIAPGEFVGVISVYTDCADEYEVQLTITGKVVASHGRSGR